MVRRAVKASKKNRDRDSAGAVEKACRVLKSLGDPRNSRLTDIAAYCNLQKPTVLRLLTILEREGLVTRDEATKHYSLGRELHALKPVSQSWANLVAAARPSIDALVDAFEDTVTLYVQSGAEAVCVDIRYGTYPLRAVFLEVGGRRALGAGSGTVPFLVWAPAEETLAMLDKVESRLRSYPRITRALIERQIRSARSTGYVIMLDVAVQGIGGIAVPIMDGSGRAIASLSIGASTERISGRRNELARALKREAAATERRLRATNR